ncbi:trehalose-phosphatase [Sphingomonas endolithica]|uniref:trehalose-phosphatase n=1 Tax=Sphingomonas endolithica TaxID=2972485 RepID=UPI0021AF1052|nr:trehalose-phosphatase [Sphingomonas sp. ZFBP2030]
MQSIHLPEPPSALLDDASLFLDFDGTLVELADRPDAVHVDAALATLLTRLRVRLEGRVAIVSGRSIAQIDGFLGAALDGIAVVGSHGAEIRTAGDDVVRPERPATMLEAERAFGERFGGNRGVVIEVKSLGVAIHYRLAPEIEEEAMALVASFAAQDGLAVQHGKMMSELRVAGHDKGTAIMALAETAPFAGHMPVFAGDDLTDETGFVACAHAGGGGILIGAARATAGTWRVADVPQFRNWLEQAA